MRTTVLVIIVLAAGQSARSVQTRSSSESVLDVKHTQNTSAVPQYEVFEVTFEHQNTYTDPFSEVAIEVTFNSPSKEQVRVGGFHYGCSSGTTVRKDK